ncbi:MAG TPA: hypothetical protein VGC52_11905 [Gemmatimonadaceae bacterium]
MRIVFALTATLIAAGCRKADDAIRRDDTTTVPPVSVLADSPVAGLTKACGITGLPVVTDNGIGELREGLSVADVKARCDVVSDSEELGTEGMTERVLIVRIAGETVRAIVNDDRISRIEISSPRFTTTDSLGVDTPLRRIARMRGARFFPGEGGVYGFIADHCALSFRFSVPLRPPRGGGWTAASIDSAHGDAAVDRVLVTRCQR